LPLATISERPGDIFLDAYDTYAVLGLKGDAIVFFLDFFLAFIKPCLPIKLLCTQTTQLPNFSEA